ncbi:MAG: Lrp/AsnC ligand binding domain-containing protein [Thermofilaceae archaeon]|nr:Lrp/AsnC ligand binding domain-containing protein [Thermofilaceae archaeon]MCX8180718.1 Lrp/AsnC ligand binding domain-containing protein [Thermofilaceae archaeon]MDW8003822.1 Lrp/AsnC ligand binding domain-containing protein [Thermofilaceae archaeon]
MPTAYVLISTDVGAEREVLERLKEFPEVEEAYVVYGIYDLVVKIDVERQEDLREVLTNKLRKLDKVRSTLTMIAVEGFERWKKQESM